MSTIFRASGRLLRHENAKKMVNIPRDAVRIMSGFSEEVAIAVTQPLWPAIEPR